MIRGPWAPLAICAAVALAHRPAFPANPPVVFDEKSAFTAPLPPEQCETQPPGPPPKVSPFSCRLPKQSPNLDVPQNPEWWSKLTLPDIPIERPWEVQAALARIVDSPKRRTLVRAALERSGGSAPHIIAALAARKLPRALAALPLLESAYSETAVSKAGAVGLWQLMPATAKKLGLVVTPTYDERRNPEKSTEAALDHLEHLFARFGTWDLALAAYDRGEPGMKRALKRNGVSDYWSLVDLKAIPEETRAYVPSLLALSIIFENAEHFSLDGPRAPPRSVALLDIPYDTPLSIIARAAGTSILGLRRSSPELISGDTVPAEQVYIPASGLARARVMLPLLLGGLGPETEAADPEFDWGRDETKKSTSPSRSDPKPVHPKATQLRKPPRSVHGKP